MTAGGRVGPAAAHKRQPNDAGVERAFPRPREGTLHGRRRPVLATIQGDLRNKPGRLAYL